MKCLNGGHLVIFLTPLWNIRVFLVALQQLILRKTDVKAGIIHQRGEGQGVIAGEGRRVGRVGLRRRENRVASLLQGAVAAAGGRHKSPPVPKQVVVVSQRGQQRLGLGAHARVLAGRAGAALAVAEGVEIAGRQGAGGDVGEREAAAAARGHVVRGDLAGRGCSCDF